LASASRRSEGSAARENFSAIASAALSSAQAAPPTNS
jgi:hypothetical protein